METKTNNRNITIVTCAAAAFLSIGALAYHFGIRPWVNEVSAKERKAEVAIIENEDLERRLRLAEQDRKRAMDERVEAAIESKELSDEIRKLENDKKKVAVYQPPASKHFDIVNLRLGDYVLGKGKYDWSYRPRRSNYKIGERVYVFYDFKCRPHNVNGKYKISCRRTSEFYGPDGNLTPVFSKITTTFTRDKDNSSNNNWSISTPLYVTVPKQAKPGLYTWRITIVDTYDPKTRCAKEIQFTVDGEKKHF